MVEILYFLRNSLFLNNAILSLTMCGVNKLSPLAAVGKPARSWWRIFDVSCS